MPEVQVKIFDETLNIDIQKELETFKPDIIGVTALTPYINETYEFLDTIGPTIYTVIGGIHASSVPEEALQHANCVVVGEGEIAFYEIVKNYSNGSKTTGIVQGKSIENIDEFPRTPFELLDMDAYIKGHYYPTLPNPSIGLTTGFGCPYRCPFCYNSKRTTKVRYFSAQRIVDEILYLHNKFGVNSFYFYDDDPLLNVKRLKELESLFEKHGITKWIKWACQSRATTVNLPVLQQIKRIGCASIAFGFESVNERMLKYWKNNTIKISDIEKAVKLTDATGITVCATFMFGYIDETLEEMKETYRWILNHDEMAIVTISTIIPFINTMLWEQCEANNCLPQKIDYSTLTPSLLNEETLIINQKVPKKTYIKFLKEACRMTYLHTETRRNPNYRYFFAKLGKEPVFYWAWLSHPIKMTKLLYRIPAFRRKKIK